jgi:hypothetical protein
MDHVKSNNLLFSCDVVKIYTSGFTTNTLLTFFFFLSKEVKHLPDFCDKKWDKKEF